MISKHISLENISPEFDIKMFYIKNTPSHKLSYFNELP